MFVTVFKHRFCVSTLRLLECGKPVPLIRKDSVKWKTEEELPVPGLPEKIAVKTEVMVLGTVPFVALTNVSPSNHVLDGVEIPLRKGAMLGIVWPTEKH